MVYKQKPEGFYWAGRDNCFVIYLVGEISDTEFSFVDIFTGFGVLNIYLRKHVLKC